MVSITFDQPEYLWFLFALPLLWVTHFFMLRNAKHRALKFANFAVLKRATGSRLITKNYTVLLIRSAIIVCAVLAVCQASVWYEGVTNENEYVIALDTSASMAAQDMIPSRLDAAKQYARDFVLNLDSQTQVGLVSFSGITFIEQPMTTQRADVFSSLEEVEIEASGTDLAGAIITSTNLLVNSERGRAIILITDGSNTIQTFTSQSVQRAAQYAQINRVKIYAIGVGSPDSGPIGYLPEYYNVSSSYNADTLEFLANATGGNYYLAADVDSLRDAYTDIRDRETTSLLQFNITPGMMLIALMLILIEWGLINTRFRTLP